MIDLDKRILDGKKPLTAFDGVDSKYIGTDCFFSDKSSDFADLSRCQIGKLTSFNAVSGMFGASKNNSFAVFNFCLPCEWVKDIKEERKEVKYRPFTNDEFQERFKVGDVITYRSLYNSDEITIAPISKIILTNDFNILVSIGSTTPMRLSEWFYEIEYENTMTGEYQPFGVEE